MQTGIDKRQLEALKALGRRWAGDPVQLRFVVVLVLFAIGWLAVERPMAAAYAAARAGHADARHQARLAEELRHFTGQQKLYAERVAVPGDLVDWQNYVLDRLRGSSATLISLEPKATLQKQSFTVVDMELVARGSDYAEFVDFMERLEHGPRFVRLEKVRLERQQANLFVTLVLKGLVKTTSRPAGGKDGEKDGEKDGAASGADDGAGAADGRTAGDGGEPAGDAASEAAAAAGEAAAAEGGEASDD